MLSLKEFLFKLINESTSDDGKLKHIVHTEEHVLDGGHEGTMHAIKVLKNSKKEAESSEKSGHVTTKYDGSPSVVSGTNPENNKFFVASKSAFNKTPKINYTEEDIEKNHGHAPGLVAALKHSLRHLPKVLPKHGVFQGDLMHTEDNKHIHDNGSVSFTPNTITYTAHGDEAKKAKNSKLGFAVHTQYHGSNLEDMKAEPIKNYEQFSQHKDVHLITPEYKGSGVKMSRQNSVKFNEHLKKAEEHSSVADHSKVEPHKEHVKTYINKTIRDNTEPTVKGYVAHLKSVHQKAIDGVKTEKSKAAKTEKMEADLLHVKDNKEHFENALAAHNHIAAAKDVLVNHMNQHFSGFEHHINGKESSPEGYVYSSEKGPVKLVDRKAFSAANFAKVRG